MRRHGGNQREVVPPLRRAQLLGKVGLRPQPIAHQATVPREAAGAAGGRHAQALVGGDIATSEQHTCARPVRQHAAAQAVGQQGAQYAAAAAGPQPHAVIAGLREGWGMERKGDGLDGENRAPQAYIL